LLRESAERFVARSYDVEGRNALARSAPGFNVAHWATYAELGWLMMLVPEDLGGLGASFGDAAVLLEAFGYGLQLEPFAAHVVLPGALLCAAAAEPAAASALEAMADGTAHVAVAYRDADAVVRVRGRVLEGVKTGVPFAAGATTLLVTARDELDELAIVLVDAASPDIVVEEHLAIDGTRAAAVRFNGAAVTARLPLADPAAALERALDQADAALGAEAVGIMARAYHDSAAHVRQRLQFGRPIATFQTVRHRIVDMFVELELARAAAAIAAEAIERDGADRAHAVSLAKLQVARSGRFVCENAVQLHGAIGIAAEAAVSHALARITNIAATFGDTAFHRTRYLSTREGTLP
jgi:alkylation response protein AidB-like acyl-CoA dehydrogenase